jgi:hypothetical protein
MKRHLMALDAGGQGVRNAGQAKVRKGGATCTRWF